LNAHLAHSTPRAQLYPAEGRESRSRAESQRNGRQSRALEQLHDSNQRTSPLSTNAVITAGECRRSAGVKRQYRKYSVGIFGSCVCKHYAISDGQVQAFGAQFAHPIPGLLCASAS